MKGHELIYEVGDYDYQWAVFGVFRRELDGAYFWATDGGCSCNGPWEFDRPDDYGDWTPITKDSFQTFSRELRDWAERANGDDTHDSAPNSTVRERALRIESDVARDIRAFGAGTAPSPTPDDRPNLPEGETE